MLQKAYNTRQMQQAACTQRAHKGHTQTQQATPDVWDKKKVKPHMTTQDTWYVAEGREQRASVKDRWQTKGTNKLRKLHQMSETERR